MDTRQVQSIILGGNDFAFWKIDLFCWKGDQVKLQHGLGAKNFHFWWDFDCASWWTLLPVVELWSDLFFLSFILMNFLCVSECLCVFLDCFFESFRWRCLSVYLSSFGCVCEVAFVSTLLCESETVTGSRKQSHRPLVNQFKASKSKQKEGVTFGRIEQVWNIADTENCKGFRYWMNRPVQLLLLNFQR